MNGLDGNDSISSKSNQTDDGQEHLEKVGSINWTKLFRVFLIKIPLWLVTVVLVLIGGWLGYSKLTTEKPVTLRPAITDALKVQITITTCNDKIDAAGYDIRDEETKLENKFRDKENVDEASVLIQRDEKLCNDRTTQSKK